MPALRSLSDSFPSTPTPDDIEKFCTAAHRGDRETVEQYLDQYGADIIDKRDNINARAITWAAYAGKTEIVDLLLERGADINAGGTNDKPALTWAADMGRRDVAKLLLDKGADIGVKDQSGETPLDYAKRRSNKDIAQLFDNYLEERAEKARLEEERKQEERMRAISGARREMLKKNPPPKLKRKTPKHNR